MLTCICVCEDVCVHIHKHTDAYAKIKKQIFEGVDLGEVRGKVDVIKI